MNSDNIGWLTTVPASDCNFKVRLQTATVEEIKIAISMLDGVKGNKVKTAALERELRRRKKNEQSKD